MIINQTSKSLISKLFSSKKDLSILFLSNSKEIFDKYFDINYTLLEDSPNFQMEILNFNEHLMLINSLTGKMKKQTKEIWKLVCSCISGYLIKQSYSKICKNRFYDFYHHQNNKATTKNMIIMISLI